jgi:uncharacterized membrane protein
VSSLDRTLIWLDSAVCSQNPGHSFWIDGRPLPLCARDLGLFAGVVFGLLLLGLWRPRRSWLWLLGVIPMAIDGANSFAADGFSVSAYVPTNTLRLATGLVAGVSLALVLTRRLSLLLEARRRGRDGSASFGFTPLPKADRRIALLGAGTPGFGAVAVFDPYLALALLGTAGALALLVLNNRLTHPMPAKLAWALALPELAAFAAAKQGLLLLLR